MDFEFTCCYALEEAYVPDAPLAGYLIAFDDDGNPYPPSVVECQWDEGDPDVGLSAGCEYCYHAKEYRERQALGVGDFATLNFVANYPDQPYKDEWGNMNPVFLERLHRVGYLWHTIKDAWMVTPQGRDALENYKKGLEYA